MPHIEVVPPERAEGELAAVYAEVLRKRGALANVHRIHSLQPRTLATHIDFYLSVLFGPSGLSRRERETIAVAVSQSNGCDYCVEHHADALGRHQKDAATIADLKRDGDSGRLTPRERALVQYARKLTQSPTAVGRSDVDALRAVGLADEEILMANLTASYFNFVNRVVLGLGVELEDEASGPYKY
jgi:uncharacterized peroxidase-related enzyme